MIYYFFRRLIISINFTQFLLKMYFQNYILNNKICEKKYHAKNWKRVEGIRIWIRINKIFMKYNLVKLKVESECSLLKYIRNNKYCHY